MLQESLIQSHCRCVTATSVSSDSASSLVPRTNPTAMDQPSSSLDLLLDKMRLLRYPVQLRDLVQHPGPERVSLVKYLLQR